MHKKPGLRPIGMREILRKIAKELIMIFRKDIADSVEPLQLSASQEAGAEEAIQAM